MEKDILMYNEIEYLGKRYKIHTHNCLFCYRKDDCEELNPTICTGYILSITSIINFYNKYIIE